MHRATVETYEQRWRAYERSRPAVHHERARALAAAVRAVARPADATAVLADLGCGPGGYLDALGAGDAGGAVVALDAAAAMVRRAVGVAPGALPVRAELGRLPFARGSLAGAWARNTYVHLPAVELPSALRELHRALAPGAPVVLSFRPGDGTEGIVPDADLGDCFFATWTVDHLADVFVGAGFALDAVEPPAEPGHPIFVRARRAPTLADAVGPAMRLLLCGLNPSVVSADAGYGFAGPSNRFWKAATAAGIVTVARDPARSLVVDGVGMTDLVKRATARSSEVGRDEYRAGAARVERLVRWLAPGAVCFVGLEGWRAAVDRTARPGWQPRTFGGRPAYVMPSTSGLNASSSLDDLVGHLQAAATPPTGPTAPTGPTGPTGPMVPDITAR